MQALVRTVRGSFARHLSQSFTRLPMRVAAALLVAALSIQPSAQARPRPLDPGTVHVKVLRRGVGNLIAVQLADGIQLFGRIIEVGDHSFSLQLHNDPQPTEIFYTDVAYLTTGFNTGQKIFMFSTIGAFAGVGIWSAVHFSNLAHKQLVPPTPPTPPAPVFP